jgi:hypothetical protein
MSTPTPTPVQNQAPARTFAPFNPLDHLPKPALPRPTKAERHDRAHSVRRNTAARDEPFRPEHEDPLDPLHGFTPAQLDDLVDDLLEDWDCPDLTELGLCRAHRLSLRQVLAVSKLPKFQRALETQREIHASREDRTRAATLSLAAQALRRIAEATPTNATHAKEIRLAAKLLTTFTIPKPTPQRPR